MYACLHAVALAVSFEGLGGELLNRLTALDGGELDPPAERRRDTDAEHHVLIAELRRPRPSVPAGTRLALRAALSAARRGAAFAPSLRPAPGDAQTATRDTSIRRANVPNAPASSRAGRRASTPTGTPRRVAS